MHTQTLCSGGRSKLAWGMWQQGRPLASPSRRGHWMAGKILGGLVLAILCTKICGAAIFSLAALCRQGQAEGQSVWLPEQILCTPSAALAHALQARGTRGEERRGRARLDFWWSVTLSPCCPLDHSPSRPTCPPTSSRPFALSFSTETYITRDMHGPRTCAKLNSICVNKAIVAHKWRLTLRLSLRLILMSVLTFKWQIMLVSSRCEVR